LLYLIYTTIKRNQQMKRNIIFYSFLIFVCFLFFSCLSPYSGPEEETTITITLGSPGNSRILVGNTGPDPEFLDLDHELWFNGVKVPVTVATDTDATFGTIRTLTATVTLSGTNNALTVRAYDPNNTNPNLSSFGTGTRILRAVTASPVTITSGQTSANVPMVSAMEVNSWTQLIQAMGGPTDASRAEIIFLTGGTYTATTNEIYVARPIYLRTLNSVTINRGSWTGPFFNVDSGGTLNLQDNASGMLILNGGGAPVDSPLILVSGGTLNMHDGVTLQNNHNDDIVSGGAVRVASGRFNMSGGTITGNTADYNGGGVFVESGSPGNPGFVMSGGTIMENTAARGGGVFVASTSARFTMGDGTIRSNIADDYGGGVFVASGGIFTKEGGNIFGWTDGTTYVPDRSNSATVGHALRNFNPAGDIIDIDVHDATWGPL
jgi:hypothetical protein